MILRHVTENSMHIEFEPSLKWVRVMFGNEVIPDSRRAFLLRTVGPASTYYFPKENVRMDLLRRSDEIYHSPHLGDAMFLTVKVGDRIAENAAWSYPEPISKRFDLSGYVAFDWDKMDAWFEEAEEVFVHPRDPHHRIDVIQSTRHVVVVVLGETVAESQSPVLLFETGLPTRYYLPKLDVRMDLLQPSDTVTACPYKGTAAYYSARVHDRIVGDVAWYYTYPTSEVAKIAGRICFFNERVDALLVDGVEQPKPKTPWS